MGKEKKERGWKKWRLLRKVKARATHIGFSSFHAHILGEQWFFPLFLHTARPREATAQWRHDDVDEHNRYDDDDGSELDVLHAHGPGKVPASRFEGDGRIYEVFCFIYQQF